MRRLGGRLVLVLAVAGAIVGLVSTAGCRKKSGTDTLGGEPGAGGRPFPLRVQLDWVPEPEFGGLYEARASGAYERAGLAVELLGGGASTPVVQLVAAGHVAVGVIAGEDVVLARARGADVVALFATFQHSPQGVMVHAARGVRSLEDFAARGGTLALDLGSPFAARLKKQLGAGRLAFVPYDGGISKFLADPMYAQQCFVTSEPLAAKEKGSDPQVFSAPELGFDPYAAVVITGGATLKSERPRLDAFVRATAEGWRRYLADPGPANATMARLNPAMDAATFAAIARAQAPLIETDETRVGGLGVMTASRWSSIASMLVDAGVIAQDKAPAPEECFAPVAQ